MNDRFSSVQHSAKSLSETCTLTDTASFEMVARDLESLTRASALIVEGSTVSITWLGRDTHDQRVAAACAIRNAGLDPLPHLAARGIDGVEECRHLLRRLNLEAGVTQIFIIGGDVERVPGGFSSSLELLASAVPAQLGITKVGFAGYPEGHPKAARHAIDSALETKIAVAMDAGIEPFVITQFGFSAAPVVEWLDNFRARGNDALVRVGLAGPARVRTLLRFARLCGVAGSARALFGGEVPVARPLTQTSAEPLIRQMVASGAFRKAAPLSLHVFAFGGLERAARWIDGLALKTDSFAQAGRRAKL